MGVYETDHDLPRVGNSRRELHPGHSRVLHVGDSLALTPASIETNIPSM